MENAWKSDYFDYISKAPFIAASSLEYSFCYEQDFTKDS